MAARILATLLAVGTIVFASLIITVVLWFPEPLALGRSSAEPDARLSQQTAMGQFEADLFLGPGLAWQLDIHVERDTTSVGPIRPTVIVEMVDMAMGRVEPPLHIVGSGEFHAEGQFPHSGRWRFRMGFQDELFDLIVSAPGEKGN